MDRKEVNNMTKNEIFAEIKDMLVDMLGVRPEEVTLKASLLCNLGIESIDFLDINFRLEKNLGVKISLREFFQPDIMSGTAFFKDNKFTSAGISLLHNSMPSINFTAFKESLPYMEFINLLTVGALLYFLCQKLEIKQ